MRRVEQGSELYREEGGGGEGGGGGGVSFFFNDTATTEIYTLSLHDALPIYKHNSKFTIAHRIKTHKTTWCLNE